MPQEKTTCLVSLGSNLFFGDLDPVEILKSCILHISCLDISIVKISRFYWTKSYPLGFGKDFVNAALEIRVASGPEELLRTFQALEISMGRERTNRWGPRTLDIDIIAFGNKILPNRKTFLDWCNLDSEKKSLISPKKIIIPHPRMHERSFVLGPLMDISESWRHPVFNKTIKQMYSKLEKENKAEVRPI